MGELCDQFAALFAGHTEVHGVHKPGARGEGGKAEGKSFTVREPVTEDHYAQHLAGKASLGIVPITTDHTVNFCAIDVDVYPANPAFYLRLIHRYALPLCPFQSKSGGLHLYMFFSTPCPAPLAVEYASTFRRALGLPEDTEIFPKQKSLSEGASGNWLNIPCFGESRLLWAAGGGALTQEQSVAEAWAMRRTPEEIGASIAMLPFAPAPPCLQSMYISGAAGVAGKNRNVFLFNAAVYLKARYGENFGPALEQVNRGLDAPISEQELHNTIVKSHTKNSYTYQCGDANLKCFCCRDACKQREYGRGGKSVSEFVYEELTQVKTDPPYYVWRVNGVDLVFYSESALRDQSKFADLAMRYLHKVPNMLKLVAWADILRTAFSAIKVQDAEGEDMTEKTLLFAYMAEFIFDRATTTREALLQGCVYKDTDNDKYMFKGADLTDFLYTTKRLTSYMPREMMIIAKDELHAAPHVLRMGKRSLRVWAVPGDVLREKFSAAVAEMEAFTNGAPPVETGIHQPMASTPPQQEIVTITDPEGDQVVAVPAYDFRAALAAKYNPTDEPEDPEGLY